MTIYSLSTASTYYVVRIEWDAWTTTPADRDLRMFAQGAASLREGGPVGDAAVHSVDPLMFAAEVWVNCLSPEGTKF